MRFLASIFIVSLLFISHINKSFAVSDNKFSALPNKCVLNNKDANCNTEVTLSWELESAQNICVLKNDEIIFCQNETLKGTHTIQISSNKSLLFKLVEMDSLVELSKIKFNLLYLGKTSSKRRKLPWQIL